jgi:hypothetical protein
MVVTEEFRCPQGLAECIRTSCRYYSFLGQCDYVRQKALDGRRQRTAEAADLMRVSESDLKGNCSDSTTPGAKPTGC